MRVPEFSWGSDVEWRQGGGDRQVLVLRREEAARWLGIAEKICNRR